MMARLVVSVAANAIAGVPVVAQSRQATCYTASIIIVVIDAPSFYWPLIYMDTRHLRNIGSELARPVREQPDQPDDGDGQPGEPGHGEPGWLGTGGRRTRSRRVWAARQAGFPSRLRRARVGSHGRCTLWLAEPPCTSSDALIAKQTQTDRETQSSDFRNACMCRFET